MNKDTKWSQDKSVPAFANVVSKQIVEKLKIKLPNHYILVRPSWDRIDKVFFLVRVQTPENLGYQNNAITWFDGPLTADAYAEMIVSDFVSDFRLAMENYERERSEIFTSQ